MKTKAALTFLPHTLAPTQKGALIGLFGFLCGFGSLFGALNPFGAACVAAVPKRYLPAAVLGVLTGTLLSAGSDGGRYPTAFFLILVLRLLLGRTIREGRMKPVLLSLLCMAGGSLSVLLYSFLFPPSPVYLFLQTAELILSGTLSYFFAGAAEVLLRGRTLPVLTFAQQTGLGVLLLSTVTVLAGLPLSVCNPGLIAGGLAVLLAGRRWNIAGASVIGILISIGLCLADFRLVSLCGVLIPACFLSGVFSPLGKGGQTVSLLFFSAFGFLLLGMPVSLLYRLADLLFACLCYLMLPASLIGTAESGEIGQGAAASLRLLQDSLSSRLQFAADTLTDLQTELQTVSRGFDGLTAPDGERLCDRAAERVCRDCPRTALCWGSRYAETAAAFANLLAKTGEKGYCTAELLPEPLQESCCRPTLLAEAFHAAYLEQEALQSDRLQMDASRSMLFEQFRSLSGLLWETGSRLGSVGRFDAGLTRLCLAAFTRLELPPDRLCCTVDRMGRAHLELYLTEPCRHAPSRLCEALAAATGRSFAPPTVTAAGQKTRLCFFENPDYRVECAVQQAYCGDNQISGDSYTYFTDAAGYTYLLLSDGMGNGRRAAIDSVMTCSLTEKLILSGFGTEAALKLLNTSLLVRSTDESLSTVDLAQVDCYTGTVTFYKAGAASSFVCTGTEVNPVTASALPVGIIPTARYEQTVVRLRPEQFLVMVSDGAVTGEDDWLTAEILRNAHRPARELSAALLSAARRHTEPHPDDITVLVAKLVRNE